jgi:hypothetical protein
VKPYHEKLKARRTPEEKCSPGDAGPNKIFFRPGCANFQIRSSDALGFYKQQNDSTDEHERADCGRDEMIVGGVNVDAEKLDGLSRSREAQSRIREHDDSQDDQTDCDDGFHVYFEFNFFG